MKEVTSCPVCLAERLDQVHSLVLERSDYLSPERQRQKTNDYHRNHILFMHLTEADLFEARFLQCSECGFICFTPRPTPEDLQVKYELVAEERDTEAREDLRRLVDQRGRRGRLIEERLRPFLRRSSGRAVDIGGADGHCLGGFTGSFEAGVLDFEDRELIPGVRRFGSSVDDLSPQDRFDLVITNHTLEHIPDLRNFIGAIRKHLADGGLLYIEVPLGSNGEIYQTRNVLTHVNFFSEGSLGRLLEECGLIVEEVRTAPTLSINRYLPVITAVARREDAAAKPTFYKENAYAITRGWEGRSLRLPVFIANMRLVLASPWRYLKGYLRRRRLLGA